MYTKCYKSQICKFHSLANSKLYEESTVKMKQRNKMKLFYIGDKIKE